MSLANNDWRLNIPEGIPGEEVAFDCFGHQWRKIDGYEDYYITDQGEVVSFANPHRPRILETWPNQRGHRMLRLSGRKYYYIHRLLANAFMPNLNNDPVVRHLDDDPENNYLGNLCWGTHKDNREDMIRNDHDYRKSVYCLETDTTYRSGAEAARALRITKPQVSQCCKGITGHANGFHLCYEDDIEDRINDKKWTRNRSYKPLVAISPDGEEFEFESRKEAAKYIGIPDCGISSVINGHLPHTHGWRFREGD